MSKHTAPTSLRTLAIELGYHAQFGINTPDRNGKHRHIDAFTAVNDALKGAA